FNDKDPGIVAHGKGEGFRIQRRIYKIDFVGCALLANLGQDLGLGGRTGQNILTHAVLLELALHKRQGTSANDVTLRKHRHLKLGKNISHYRLQVNENHFPTSHHL
ncbi:hypothetical protein, partial [uncultured Desulfovibrio sp.]|uniref:hypothetical protein n=1 Tax=uncultured Desulfovibrio sp. TaxID=167968 RepID=UPI002670097D